MYPFETGGEDNWMGRHFFTGGLMPAADTLLHFQQTLVLQQRWLLPGSHYRDTANHWLHNQDRNRDEVLTVLSKVYGDADAARRSDEHTSELQSLMRNTYAVFCWKK